MAKAPEKKKVKLDFNRPTFDGSLMTNLANDEEDFREFDRESLISSAGTETINVVLRLKPNDEIPNDYKFNYDENHVAIGNKVYSFSSILKQETDQTSIYDSSVRPVIDNIFESNGAVWCSYGVSSSGKTFTILGDKDTAGIVPRALTQIFSEFALDIATIPCVKIVNDQMQVLDDENCDLEINATSDLLQESKRLAKGRFRFEFSVDKLKKNFSCKDETTEKQNIYIWVSFLEIFNEKLIDLLQSEKNSTTSRPLQIISNNQNSYVLGLTALYVSTLEEALEVLQHGVRRVNYASTGLNSHSSRSHTVFTINVIKEFNDSFVSSSFKFCDLAGAERAGKTGNAGDRLKEAGRINKSLSVLGRCLEAVQHNQKPDNIKKQRKPVPVRESKLTFLLQNALEGHENFVMIVNLLPNLDNLEENMNVLHFGQICKQIVTQKREPLKHSRRTSTYSYFLQNAKGSPALMNSSLIDEGSCIEETYESSLDISYQVDRLSKADLHHKLRLKEVECKVLRQQIEKKEREWLAKEMTIRESVIQMKKKELAQGMEHFEMEKVRLQDYYMKKQASEQAKFNRKFNDLIEENRTLYDELQKLRKKFNVPEEDESIELLSSDGESEHDDDVNQQK